jgi:hypothetical protein
MEVSSSLEECSEVCQQGFALVVVNNLMILQQATA